MQAPRTTRSRPSVAPLIAATAMSLRALATAAKQVVQIGRVQERVFVLVKMATGVGIGIVRFTAMLWAQSGDAEPHHAQMRGKRRVWCLAVSGAP